MRVFADLNPRYPSKGERRWTVFLCDGGRLEHLPRSFTSRKSAERLACKMLVKHELVALGIPLQETNTSPS